MRSGHTRVQTARHTTRSAHGVNDCPDMMESDMTQEHWSCCNPMRASPAGLCMIADGAKSQESADGRMTLRQLLHRWLCRWTERRELESLPDAALKDMGITRYDAFHEARKPFWRG